MTVFPTPPQLHSVGQWYVSKVTKPTADAENHWVDATGEIATDDDGTLLPTPRLGSVWMALIARSLILPMLQIDEDKYLRAVVTYLD